VCLLHVKSGDRQAWRRWGRTARHAAMEARDCEALAWVTAQEARGHYYAGEMPEALAAAQAALSARVAPCAGRALAAALTMRAYAAMGEADAARQAMYLAEQTYQALTGSAPASAFGYGESQLRFYEGDTLLLLGETNSALPILDRALQLCERDDYATWAMIRLSRAACLISHGDLDGGIAYAIETLVVLGRPQRRGVVTDRGRELLAALPPLMRASRQGWEFQGLLEDTDGMRQITA
jgi:tetratricopeptide (TPR) repeat protein